MSVQITTVLFVSSSREAWGAEASLLVLAPRLAAEGINCRLWTSNTELASRWKVAVGTPAEIIPAESGSRLREIPRWAFRLRGLRRTDWVADAVVFFNIDLAPAALALRLMRRARPRLILDLHDYLPTASGRKKLSLIARTFDMVIAISRFSASQLGARSTSAAVLTRPIEPVERWYGLPGGRVVGIVGRVDPDKNLEMAIAAVGHLPEFRLTVRGAPSAAHSSYAADIEVQARAGLGDRVEFTGRLAGAEVFEGFDVLLVTNAAEALGRTVLEAQLRGIVVVVPDEGGAAELVENGETGFTYAAGDPHAAAAAIRKAANSDPLVRENARAVARRSSDPEAYAAAYAGILRGGRA